MIISRGRRYIFVHIPKTGGTALAQALEARAMADDILIGDTPKARKRKHRLSGMRSHGRLWKHATLADIDGLVSADDLRDCFTFTLVRNPWDRLVSYYSWLRTRRWDHLSVRLAQSGDFSTFLNDPHTVASLAAAPYGSYMRDRAGQEHCRLYIRLEHLEAELVPLWEHLGFDLGPIARVNESDRQRDWRPYYSDADAALVARIAAEDIARFGYRFDPDQAALADCPPP